MLLKQTALIATFLLLSACQSASGGTSDIPCESVERLDYHVHVQLALFVEGRQVEVPASVGTQRTCIYWLHTHDASGTIHVEASSPRDFRLGQFFRIWGQDLSSTALLDRRADASHQIRTSVNGQPFSGDPADISLEPGAVIVIAYGPPFPDLLSFHLHSPPILLYDSPTIGS